MTITPVSIPTAWNVLHQAITQRCAVRATYQDRLRVICPHALGWKNGKPKALVYQTAIIGLPPQHDPRGWRSLFVDEIQNLTITDDPWRTASNYTPHTTGIDTLAAAIT
jgi:hypothetical protein